MLMFIGVVFCSFFCTGGSAWWILLHRSAIYWNEKMTGGTYGCLQKLFHRICRSGIGGGQYLLVLATSRNRRVESRAQLPGRTYSLCTTFHAATKNRSANFCLNFSNLFLKTMTEGAVVVVETWRLGPLEKGIASKR